MKKEKFFKIIICISTGAFILWYFFFYAWSEEYIGEYEKTVNLFIKNCSRTNKLQRRCKVEQESINTLNNQCLQCIEPLQNNTDDASIMQTLIELFELNKLILVDYKRITKEKKEWYTHYTASLVFQGWLTDILAFFKTVSSNNYAIIPTKIEMHTDNKKITHVTVIVSWILCKKEQNNRP